MKNKIGRFIEAFDERTGLRTGLEKFLYEEIPASSGWHQIFGSVALFLIMIQFFTGIMLAFNYAPTPGEAYNSLRYILTEVTAGRIMRGLHHWGASMIIVIVVLHMVQVFLWGAYKKPREATWIVGVILLLLTFAYGLTGYLLPWDNRAYWGTVVSTHIGATVPVMGPYVSRLLASTGDVGVVTFARFYALHVLLLPPATMLLIGLHVFLVRRHGVMPAPGDELKPKKSFYPEQVFKDTVAVFVAFAILFTLAIAARVPLEHLADPSDTSYIPRPEWYFLFLFQMLKVFNGPLEVVGTVILPTLAILALIATPFIDRGKIALVRQRTLAMGIVLLIGIGWGGLTLAAVKSTPPQTEAASIDFSGPTQWMQLTPAQLSGVHYYRQENCATCHNVTGEEAKTGPNLLNTNKRHDAAWMVAHFKSPQSTSPNSMMTPVNLSGPQLNDLAAAMLALTPDNGDVISTAPGFAADGAALYQKNFCSACHMVNGVGGKTGPALNGLAARRTEAWAIEHFQNPQKMSPGTPMPPYKFATEDMQNMVSYLFTLPDKAPGQ
ncbi:MAG: cytochrome b N-terminal domain-containing protein [Bryobacteraceae bacterium]|jgi:ubiquinol-cytochrome c reductase cytochrome b subunit